MCITNANQGKSIRENVMSAIVLWLFANTVQLNPSCNEKMPTAAYLCQSIVYGLRAIMVHHFATGTVCPLKVVLPSCHLSVM